MTKAKAQHQHIVGIGFCLGIGEQQGCTAVSPLLLTIAHSHAAEPL
ncbi:MAG: hypothetical protein H6656_03900 [Ardenticatenaceae bacterium]|nr:hypothetical protein [Ardenticatenaceae bacterium]